MAKTRRKRRPKAHATATPARPASQARPPGRWRRRLPALIILGAALWAAVTGLDVSLTWDESIHGGFLVRSYLPWFQALWRGGAHTWALTPAGRFYAFEFGQVHPPLARLAMLIPLVALDRVLPLFMAVRLASVGWFALALTAVWGLSRRGAGRGAALCAVAALALMPRMFGHAHLAVLDMPVTALWIATAWAARAALRRRWLAPVAGLVFGLALLAKVNALFLPFALVPWLAFYGRRRAIWPVACMAVLGPLVFIAGWPAMWDRPLLGAVRYLADKAGYSAVLLHPFAFYADPIRWLGGAACELLAPSGRSVVPVYYLGRTWGARPAPWHYAPVMLIATMPLGLLAGLAAALARRRPRLLRRPFITLCALNAAVAVGPFALPGTPAYDGIRLFLPALPWLAMLSGVGLWRLYRALRARPRVGPRVARRLALAFWVWQALCLVWLHPAYLSFYGGAVGGVWGANRLGFETTYWGDSLTNAALVWVNRTARPGDVVLIGPTGNFVPEQLQLYGLLRRDLVATNDLSRRDWDYVVLIPRQGMFRDWMWDLYRDGRPAFASRLMGVPQCLIYARPDRSPPAQRRLQ